MSAPLLAGPGREAERLELAGDGLVVLARGQWPQEPPDTLPQLPGFIVSSFSPLVAEAARRCLQEFFGPPPACPERAQRTGVVLASPTGDIATARAVAAAVDGGRRVPPMLFFQSNVNAVIGYITARWGLAGPVVCTSPASDPVADARHSAALLVADGDADAVLIIIASQEHGPGTSDHAEAVLVGPPAWRGTGIPAAGPPPSPVAGPSPSSAPAGCALTTPARGLP